MRLRPWPLRQRASSPISCPHSSSSLSLLLSLDVVKSTRQQLVQIIHSLEREYETVWGSMVKQALRRVSPGFSESYYGYKSFADLLDDAQDSGDVVLAFDETRGNYVVCSKAAHRST